MSELVARYVKTAVVFVLLWVATHFWTSCGLRRPGGPDMAPTLPSDAFCWLQLKDRSPDAMNLGDIVVFEYQVPGTERTAFMGRVLGRPGDVVKMVAGEAWVNGTKADTGYVIPASKTDETFDEFVVPRDSLYVLMDNRKFGLRYDSRAHGPIGSGAILAKVRK